MRIQDITRRLFLFVHTLCWQDSKKDLRHLSFAWISSKVIHGVSCYLMRCRSSQLPISPRSLTGLKPIQNLDLPQLWLERTARSLISIIKSALSFMKPIGLNYKTEDTLPKSNALKSGARWQWNFKKSTTKRKAGWKRLFSGTTLTSICHVTTLWDYINLEGTRSLSFVTISSRSKSMQRGSRFLWYMERSRIGKELILFSISEMETRSTALFFRGLEIVLLTFLTQTWSFK